jgi:GNAT superfamily N-acetyltransferase
MEISEAGPGDVDEIVEFMMTRTPQQDRVLLRLVFHQKAVRSRRVLVAREAGGALAGVGIAQAPENLPPGLLSVMVTTRSDLGGRGLGSRLYSAALADLADLAGEVTQLVTAVLDGDQPSLDVARHWGFTSVQRSMTVSRALADATAPEPPGDDVTFEVCDDLVFDDDAAVEAMLRVSQTNPEAEQGVIVTLSDWRDIPTPGQRPVAVLTRVKHVPAAISFGVADGDQMHVVYTGVDPALRGRALARATKEFLHAHAKDSGIRIALTDNAENNAGIRHVNEQLGYTPHSSWHYLIRQRP